MAVQIIQRDVHNSAEIYKYMSLKRSFRHFHSYVIIGVRRVVINLVGAEIAFAVQIRVHTLADMMNVLLINTEHFYCERLLQSLIHEPR